MVMEKQKQSRLGKAVAGTLGSLALVGCVSNPEGFSGDVSMNVKDHYSGSGFRVTDERADQFSASIRHERLPGWKFLPFITYTPGKRDLTELDLTVEKSGEVGGKNGDLISWNVGGSAYIFGLGDLINAHDAYQLDGKIGTNIYDTNVSFKAAQIFGDDSGKGRQYTLNAGREFGLGGGFNLSLSGNVLFNDRYFTNDTGFSIADASVDLAYKVNEDLSLSFGYTHQVPLDKSTFGDTFEDDGVFAFSVGGSF